MLPIAFTIKNKDLNGYEDIVVSIFIHYYQSITNQTHTLHTKKTYTLFIVTLQCISTFENGNF